MEVECNNVRFDIEINEDIEEELELLFDKCVNIGLCNKNQKQHLIIFIKPSNFFPIGSSTIQF